jgi:hypothetical protein
MSDLSFTNLNALSDIPDTTFQLVNGRVMCDVGLLIGETVSTLATERFTEFAYRVLFLGRKAQVVHNDSSTPPTPAGQRINSFSNPGFSTPTSDAAGALFTTSSITITARMPVVNTSITSVLG